MSGGWEAGTLIWREKIAELKITKTLNSTVYDTLETWFEDKDYFETRIYVKILKNTVQDSLHWFGVKWGKLDKHLHTYTVEPNVYDTWGQYFEAGRDASNNNTTSVKKWYFYDSSYVYIANTSLEDTDLLSLAIKKIIYNASFGDWAEANVLSSFIWQSAYEDTTAVGTEYGMALDYVTGEASYLTYAGIKKKGKTSLNDMLQWLLLFRAFAFIDSNGKFRIEHISFFNAKFTDNAVDFSAYIEDYNEVWEYENTNIPTLEKISVSTAETPTSDDFEEVNITYSNVRNRPDAQPVDFSSQLYTDLAALGTDTAPDFTIVSGFANLTYLFFDTDMQAFTVDRNSFDVTWHVDNGDTEMGSNDMRVVLNKDYTFTAVISLISGTFEASLIDRSTGTVISNVISVNATGTTTGTITATANHNDGYLLIEGVQPTGPASTGRAVGYITLIDPALSGQTYIVPVVEGIVSTALHPNAAFSQANIVNDYWKDDRVAKSGTFNETVTAFDSIYNLRRDPLKFYYSGVIQPLYGFNDGTRIGKIDKWKRSLETDFYEIDVTYQEDE